MRNHILCSAIALAAALSTPAFARPMTEVDLATLKRVAAPTASPDGRWVVFQMTETEAETYKRSTGLWLVDRNAKDAKPVAIADTAGKNETAPAFDKDGILYFLSNASGKSQVWRIDPKAGGAATQVTDTKADVSGFKISPDAAKLLAWGDIARECTDFGCDAKDKGHSPGPAPGAFTRTARASSAIGTSGKPRALTADPSSSTSPTARRAPHARSTQA